MGLTTVINLFSLAYCMLENDKRIIIVAPKSETLMKIINEVYNTILKSGKIGQVTTDYNNNKIIFNNGSEIIFNSFRGLFADYVFLTDFAFLQNQWETLLVVEPIAPTIVIQSCPDHSGSLFHIISKFSNNTLKIVNEQNQYIDEIRKNLSPKQFSQEYLCSFNEKDEKDSLMNLRVSYEEKSEIAKNAEKYGFKNVSEYLRVVALDRDLLNRLDRKPERNVFQVDTGTNIDEKERITNRIKELQNDGKEYFGKNTIICGLKADLALIRMTEKKQVAKESYEELPASICKQYMFGIGPSKSEILSDLTSLISKIDINEEKVNITYLIDEKNTLENFIRANNRFYVIWLDRTANPVGSLGVPNNIEKVFPISFSIEGPGSVLGKIIIKR
jgi:hypothetical protein